MNLKYCTVALIPVVAFLALACLLTEPATGGDPGAKPPQTLDVRYRGLVVPSKQVMLVAPLDGIVAKIKVKKGDVVKAGDTLAVMDDELQVLAVEAAKLKADSVAAINVATLALEEANIEIERAEDLFKQKAITDRELRQRRVTGKQREAELEAAKEQAALAVASFKLEEVKLRKHSVLAPFDGTVMDLATEEGASMARNDKMIALYALGQLEARINLPNVQGYFEQMKGKVGQPFQIVAGHPVNREITGRLKNVRDMIDSASATFLCEFTIENPELKMPAGFSVDLVWPPKPLAASLLP